MRVSLGPVRVLLYTLQGLFHPARKVREVFWKMFNNMYIGSADALVAGYPLFDIPTQQQFRRTELELFL